jgi:hypothetical protein
MPETRPARTDEQKWVTRALARGSLSAIGKHITTAYLIPIGVPLVTGYLAYLRSVPWDQVLLYGAVTFAGVTHGLVKFDDWLDRRRVKEKLTVGLVRVGRAMVGPGMRFGIQLDSEAAVPIEFDVVDVATRIADRVPPKMPFDRTRFVIPPRGVGWFDDHMINLGTTPRPGSLEGFLEMTVHYGRPGRLKHQLIIKKRVVLGFNADGLYQVSSATDAA